jgi:hypothetical protein
MSSVTAGGRHSPALHTDVATVKSSEQYPDTHQRSILSSNFQATPSLARGSVCTGNAGEGREVNAGRSRGVAPPCGRRMPHPTIVARSRAPLWAPHVPPDDRGPESRPPCGRRMSHPTIVARSRAPRGRRMSHPTIVARSRAPLWAPHVPPDDRGPESRPPVAAACPTTEPPKGTVEPNPGHSV